MNKGEDQIVVIGGGLAGLTFAIQMARAGHSVTLFEKEKYPFHKVCGEYIAMESWDFLHKMGVPLSEMDVPAITRLRVSAPNGNFLEHKLAPGGFGISRYTLDKLLADIAVGEGVILKENCRVENVEFINNRFIVSYGNEKRPARLVVGSYGKRSNLDIKMGREFIKVPQPSNRNYLGVKYHIRTDFPADVIELNNFKDGYCGISKVDGDKFCLCYLTTAENLRNNGSIKEMEKKVLMRNPFLKKYFTESEFLYEAPLVISQVNFSAKSAVEKHVLMAGDSAGLITPLCGNGMSMALQASKLLANMASNFLDDRISRGDLEKNYEKIWRKTFYTRLTAGRYIQHTFGKEVVTNTMIGTLKDFPTVVSKLESLTHGDAF